MNFERRNIILDNKLWAGRWLGIAETYRLMAKLSAEPKQRKLFRTSMRVASKEYIRYRMMIHEHARN